MVFLTVAFFGGLILVSLFYLTKNVPNVLRAEGERRVEIFGNVDVTSNFKSTKDNLAVVFIKLHNFVKRNRGEFTFFIQDENGNILRTVKISGENIGEDDWTKFQFPILTGIKDKNLTFVLRSDAQEAGKSVIAYTNKDGNFLFKSYSKSQLPQVAVASLQNWRQRFLGDQFFAVFYLSVLAVNLLYLMRLKKKYV